ncbi:MAG: trigger factor [Rhodospirillales bacterium 20-60-12]|nr:MAG: trigger factor [Rhodospirillales bacterium 20-60-12]HQT67431.1 trigger factor [Acetobacteraceae bacterium]
MQVTETLSEGLKRGFTIVVPQTELASKREARLAELGRTMQLPGFRPGKVPMSMVRKRYGEAVSAEILETSVNEATDQLLSDRGLRPAVQPKIDLVRPGSESDLEFTMEMEVLPEVAIPDLSAISLTRLKAPVSEGRITETLEKIAAQRRDFEPVEEPRGAQIGEQLTVDFIGRVDGVVFDGGTASDVPIEIGGTGFIPGFAEQIEGLAPGETRTIKVTFPAEYHSQDLAGKDAEFEITAKSLAAAKPVEMDDEFAKSMGFGDLAALRGAVSSSIEREYDQMSRLKLKRALLDALAELAQFTAPETLVEAEFAEIWRQVEAEQKEGNLDPEDANKDDATLRAEYRAIADRRVRLGLLVAEIGRINNITVADQDLTRALRAEAMRYQGQEQQVIEFFRKNPQAMDRFRGPIFEDKVVDYVLGVVKLEDQETTPEELAAEPAGAA